ncbi:MAG: hypothetical protein GX975_01690 [Clostridiales bacterium]|nr:hypothetical protein [Clostridiales bacterium]
MDNFEKVEQLVKKAGCSYGEAKDALEKTEWNVLDAIILLENSGKATKSSASYRTRGGATYVEAEVLDSEEAARRRPEGFSPSARETVGGGSNAKSAFKRFWEKFKDICTRNRLVMSSAQNSVILDLPIWIPALAFLLWFWGVLLAAVVAMALGCRFHFTGQDLGNPKVNEAMDAAADTASRAAERVKREFSGENKDESGSDNGGANTHN